MLDHPSAAQGSFTLLLVCTGNICRSPLAERLATAYLDQVLGEDHGTLIRVVSAGTRAAVGSTMDRDSALVLRGLGGRADRFWAQQVSSELATRADLTLTMTRDHREDVLGLAPRALARTFTLREAADLLGRVDETEVEGADLRERAQDLVRRMAAARAGRRASRADDIADPVGRSLQVQQETGEAIATALMPLLARIVSFADPAVAKATLQNGKPGAHEKRTRRMRRVS